MKTIGDQLLGYLQTHGLNTTKMAAIVNRYPGGEKVRRQHLDNLLSGTVGNPRFLHALAMAMGTTMEELLTGSYEPVCLTLHSPSTPTKETRMTLPTHDEIREKRYRGTADVLEILLFDLAVDNPQRSEELRALLEGRPPVPVVTP